MLQKVSKANYNISITSEKLRGKYMVQFQVSSINVIGESDPCFPICIRLIKPRPQIDSRLTEYS